MEPNHAKVGGTGFIFQRTMSSGGHKQPDENDIFVYRPSGKEKILSNQSTVSLFFFLAYAN